MTELSIIPSNNEDPENASPQQARMQRPAVNLALASALAIVPWGPASELVSAAVRTSVPICSHSCVNSVNRRDPGPVRRGAPAAWSLSVRVLGPMQLSRALGLIQ